MVLFLALESWYLWLMFQATLLVRSMVFLQFWPSRQSYGLSGPPGRASQPVRDFFVSGIFPNSPETVIDQHGAMSINAQRIRRRATLCDTRAPGLKRRSMAAAAKSSQQFHCYRGAGHRQPMFGSSG
jgi:hypothetical protein